MTARKLQFVGALFDGRSSKKHRVDVELTPQEIILKEPGHEPVRWAHPHLRWAAETSPFHIEHRVDDKNGKRLETLVVEDLLGQVMEAQEEAVHLPLEARLLVVVQMVHLEEMVQLHYLLMMIVQLIMLKLH